MVVFGAGPVGLFAAKSAWFMGAGRVIVIDHLEYRLEKARTFAHAETYNFTEYDDIVVHLKKITDWFGADVAIDAVGAEADGNFIQHVAAAKLKLQGGSPVALNWAIDSVRKGATVDIVTHPIPLEHIAEGYHIFSAKLDDCIKPLVVVGEH